MTLRGHDGEDEASVLRWRYVKRDLLLPGAPAGDDSRKLRGGEDMAWRHGDGSSVTGIPRHDGGLHVAVEALQKVRAARLRGQMKSARHWQSMLG